MDDRKIGQKIDNCNYGIPHIQPLGVEPLWLGRDTE